MSTEATAMDPDCLFCTIVAGGIPSRKVYADEAAYAFLDISPWHRGHTLVVPKRHVVDAFMQYLWSDEAQQAFVKFHFYSTTNDAFNQANTHFGHIEMPFTIDYLNGWARAYPEIIEKVFRDQVQRK